MTTLAKMIDAFDHDEGMDVPPSWRQGRTVYGGLSAALALQSVLHRHADLPALRAAQINYVGPAIESLRFESTLLRQGKTASWVEAGCNSADAVALRAMFLFGQSRPSSIVHQRSAAPAVQPPQAYPPTPSLSSTPSFFSNFDTRFAGTAMPVSGSDDPELIAWVRHRDAAGVHPAVALVALADALPPAAMTTFKQMAPISTMTWSFEVRQLPPPEQWLLLRSTSVNAGDGYSCQQMDIWDEQGGAVLSGIQTVALFT